MSNFQTVLVAIFLSFFVFGVLIFSGVIDLGISSNSNAPQGRVTIWGTFPSSEMYDVIDSMNDSNKELNVTYIKKNPPTYQQELIEAFANGAGPDLFIITPDMIAKNNNFIYKICHDVTPNSSNNQKDVNNIVASFKFLD